MTTALAADEFPSVTVCEMSGISYRQLSYWSITGLLVPSVSAPKGSGSRSIYSMEDVHVATLLGAVSKYLGGIGNRDFSATLRQIAESGRELIRRYDGRLPDRVYIIFMSDYEVIVSDQPVGDFTYFHLTLHNELARLAA